MIKVTATAKFQQMKPAHNAFIAKTGTGSNYIRAMKNALDNLGKDTRLKGKRAANLSPCQITFTLNDSDASSDDA